MHVGGAGSESDESEDEGEEQRGLGSSNLERINLAVPGTLGMCGQQGDESPMPEEATTAAWERLMQPTQMNLPPSTKGLPWTLPSSQEPVDEEDDDVTELSLPVVGISIAAVQQRKQQQQQQQQREEQEQEQHGRAMTRDDEQVDSPLASPEQA